MKLKIYLSLDFGAWCFHPFGKQHKTVLIALTLSFFYGISNAQKYKVTFHTATYGAVIYNSGCNDIYTDVYLSNGVESAGATNPGDVAYFNAKPTKIYGQSQSESSNDECVTVDRYCDQPVNYTLALNDCDTYSATVGDCYPLDISFTIEPILGTPLGTIGAYCSGSSFNLSASTGFSLYRWQYSSNSSSGYQDIRTTAGNSTSISFSDVSSVGLNNNIYFRYSVGNCDPNSISSGPIGPFVFAPDPISAPSYSTIKPVCQDGLDGSITVSLSRGLLSGETVVTNLYTGDTYDPSTYVPNTELKYQANGTTVSGLLAGTYYALIQSNLGSCAQVPVFTPVTIPPGPRTHLTASLSITSNYNGSQLSCNNTSDGQLAVSTNGGGNGTYQYSLDGGTTYQSSNIFSGVSAGSYGVTVKDGCATPTTATTNTATIVAPTAVGITSLTPSLCNGANNGQITVNASGGTGTLSYSKDGTSFQGSNVFTGLTTGTSYTITVKDLNNCNIISSVLVPSQLTAGSVSITHPTCSGTSKGSLSINGSAGGTGSLSWSIGGAYQSVSTPFTNVSPGTYSVTVQDGNGCTASAGSVVINQPIAASYSTSVASCATVNDGTITVSGAAGGTNTFQYALNSGSYQSSNVFSALASGTYTVKVKDGNGCVLSNSVTVGLKPAVTGAITQTSFINCFGQTTAAFNVVASGGSSPYTNYSWSNGVNGASVSNAGAGTYTVTITDSKGCQGTQSILVTQPTQLTGTTSTSNYNGVNVSCKGDSNGTINLTALGGTSPYTYSWSTGSSSQNLSNLSAGSYTVTVTDGKSCTATRSVTLTEPAASVSAALQSKNDVTCFGANNGTISILGSGGTGALSYSLDGGTTFQLSSTFTSLAAGSYSVMAKDANNCAATSPTITISTPAALSISSITKTNPLCNGTATGSIVVTAIGGTTPYQYSKDGTTFSSSNTLSGLIAGSYVVTVKDANGCTISSATQVLTDPTVLTQFSSSTPQSCAANTDGTITLTGSGGTTPYTFSFDGGITYKTSGSFTGLIAGAYSTIVKDNNGCTASGSRTVNIQPTLIGTITQSAFINCYGQTTGALTLATSGGTSPYSYAWSTGELTQNISSLGAGSYSVTIKDSKNCTASQSKTVTQPTALSLSNINSNYNGFGVSCQNSADGFINVNASGGTSPYAYSWSNGATTSSISSLTAGIYTVTLTDAKSCAANSLVTLTAPTALTLSIGAKANVTCNGGTNGSITLSAGGGAGGYSYSINGGSTWQTSSTFSSLSAGSFTVQVKDLNNCTSSTSTSITQPSVISISIGTIQSAGCGLSNGSIQSSASGGTGTLIYQWKNSSNQVVSMSPNLTNAPSGVYTLTVTDQNACSKSTTASISSPSGPGFSIINITATSCSNSSDGQATVSITSGPTPYAVNWGNGETGTTALHLSGGSNTVTVLDGNNCSSSQSFTIVTPAPIALSSVQVLSPSCPGGNDGSIQVTATGGKTPYSYAWNGGVGSSTQSGLIAGSYSLTVTDANNCVYAQVINVTDVPVIAISVVNQINPTCSSSTDGSLLVQAGGGNGSFNYTWNTGTTSSLLNNIGAGTYTITVKDNKNCLQQKEIDVVAPAAVTATLTPTSTLCNNGSDGTISVNARGGTGTFSYSKDNGNSWQSQNAFTGLAAGAYAILSKDQNGCSVSASTTVAQPTSIVITISKTDPTCGLANGSAQAVVSGGTGTYTYQWQNSLNQSYGTGTNLQNAPADTYTLTAIDANQCNANKNVTLAAYASAQFNLTNIGSTVCSYSADGSATVQVSSAQAPYTVLWSSGETTDTANKLVAGQNTVTITDANNCQVTKTVQIPSPLSISILSETIVTPVCVGGTGSIQITAIGGAGNFSYSWNGVTGQNNIQGVKAGTYNLLIQDGSGCRFTKDYTLSDPSPFTIDLGIDETICPNTTTSIGITLPNATYVWSGPNNFVSTQGIVSVGDAGKYLLTVTNSDGCKASDDIALSISNNLLKADFLAVTQAHVGDTLILVDISWPIPDQVQWHLSDSATVIYSDKDYALISFSKPGVYQVGVEATLGGCENRYFQKIIIDDQPSGGTMGNGSSTLEIVSLMAYPNPFEGKTNAHVELSQPASVVVKVYSLVTNLLIMQNEFIGDNKYDIELDFNAQLAGLYIILVESGSKTRAVRVIKL